MDSAPIRNDDLVAAMDAAAKGDTPTSRRAVYEALLAAKVIVPIVAAPEGVEIGSGAPLDRAVDISVVTLQRTDGRVGLPIFTDTDAMRAWKTDGSPYVAMAFPDLLVTIESQPPDALVINPAGPTGGEVSRREFLELRAGRLPEFGGRRQLPAGTEMLIGAPNDEVAGPALEEALRDALSEFPAVFAGYLLLVAAGGDAPRLTVGLQLGETVDEAALYALFDSVASRLQPLLAGRSVDFVVLQGTMLEHARSIGPVYLA